MIDNQILDQKIDISTDFLRIHSRTFSKVRRNSFLRVFSMKTNTPFLIMQHGGSGGMAEKFPPHVVFILYVRFLRFAVFRRDTEPLQKDRARSPKVSISQVSHELGFVDVNIFGKFFKSQLGISPREYISQCQTSN